MKAFLCYKAFIEFYFVFLAVKCKDRIEVKIIPDIIYMYRLSSMSTENFDKIGIISMYSNMDKMIYMYRHLHIKVILVTRM